MDLAVFVIASLESAIVRHRAVEAPMETGRQLIIHVVPYYPPDIGGIQNVVKGIAEGLAARYDVEVLTTTLRADGAPRYERATGVTVRRLRSIEFAHTPVAPGLVLRLLRAPRSAIVHVHLAHAFMPEIVWFTSVVRCRPFVAHFHLDLDPSGRLGWLFPVYKRYILGRTLRAAARVVALSTDQAQLLASQHGVDPKAIVVIPNAVGPRFCTNPAPEDRKHGPCRLLYAGRISPQKSLPRLLRALSQMTQPAELVIAGEGEDSAMVRELVDELRLDNVRLVGAQRGDDLLRWYRWADVFVLPSDKEGMPLAMLEAMAVGLPVVATDVLGSRETLGEAGVLVAPDPSSLACTLDRVASDADLRADLSNRSLIRAREFSWSRLIEQLQAMYEEICATTARPLM
jgi:glycosyltransferase involved in cell wall biosynthesis